MTTDELPIPTTDDPSGALRGEPRLRVRLSDPGDLVAAVPHLIGFTPADSLVLVALTQGPGTSRFRLGAVVRADLPEPDDVPAVVSACARRMGAQRPAEVALVVIGGGRRVRNGSPPRADVVEQVEALFATTRVPVHARLWVARIAGGERWRCYPPCGCSGTVGPTDGSTIAMASTMFGQVTYGSRAELEASLAPTTRIDAARMRRLVDEAFDAASTDRELGGPGASLRDLHCVGAAVAEVAAGRDLGDAEVARVAVALCDPHVRDTCLAWALEPRATPAEQLWTTLVRAVPGPEVAEPATLLAFSVLVRGGGALVGAALDRAQGAVPGHTLSGLLAELLARGVGHQEILDLVRGAGAAARDLVEGG
jgi:hypothetical protein